MFMTGFADPVRKANFLTRILMGNINARNYGDTNYGITVAVH